jgi:hypothetical protein
MSDVFISYAREDRDHAEALATALQAEGRSVWWDRTLRAGLHFDEVIERELGSARCVVVLWSQHSVTSRWVKAEAEEAATRGILVPVSIDRASPPLPFRGIQTADLSAGTGRDGQASFRRLLLDIAVVVRVGSEPAGAVGSGGTQQNVLAASPAVVSPELAYLRRRHARATPAPVVWFSAASFAIGVGTLLIVVYVVQQDWNLWLAFSVPLISWSVVSPLVGARLSELALLGLAAAHLALGLVIFFAAPG